jgi:flagellar biosynthesis/type III secretory pathway protein FliH
MLIVYAFSSAVVLLVTGVAVFTQRRFYRQGFREGYADGHSSGYASGHRDADNWWLSVEDGAQNARHAIWEEEER